MSNQVTIYSNVFSINLKNVNFNFKVAFFTRSSFGFIISALQALMQKWKECISSFQNVSLHFTAIPCGEFAILGKFEWLFQAIFCLLVLFVMIYIPLLKRRSMNHMFHFLCCCTKSNQSFYIHTKKLILVQNTL